MSLPLGTFCGINHGQNEGAFLLWERLLNEHDELKSIVELGTYQGGFAIFLNTQADVRGIQFTTFDVMAPIYWLPAYQQVDIFENRAAVTSALNPRPTLLFCDNGDKPREVEVFAGHLEEGDLLVVHDWGDEIEDDAIPEGFEPLHVEWSEELDPITRIFRCE